MTLVMNAIEVPGPGRQSMIESNQVFLEERVQKLNDEEWITGGLLMHQSRQRCGAVRLAAKCVCDRMFHVLMGERPQRKLMAPGSFVPKDLEHEHQRMVGINFVIAVGSNQQHVPHVRIGSQTLQKF